MASLRADYTQRQGKISRTGVQEDSRRTEKITTTIARIKTAHSHKNEMAIARQTSTRVGGVDDNGECVVAGQLRIDDKKSRRNVSLTVGDDDNGDGESMPKKTNNVSAMQTSQGIEKIVCQTNYRKVND